ncbi:MAG: hypothetical protein LBB90_08865 [Tannerella sp.]|jgi:hypothetical protein|nr:hypothetical protein [Tannerella sp.]
MKQQILEALKTKFEGVDEKILNRIAERLAKTVTTEEGVQPAVDGVTYQQIIDSEADRRATEATQTAVTNYEKKHGLKDGQKTEKVETGDETTKKEPDKKDAEPAKKGTEGGSDDTPAWAKALIESNKSLAEKLAGLERDKLTGTRKQKLDTVIAKLPENLRKPYGRINISDMTEDEFSTFLTETGTEVDGIAGDLESKGSVLQTPKPGGNFTKGKQPSKEDVDSVVNSML